MNSIRIEADQLLHDIKTLAQFGADGSTNSIGVTRVAYSPIDLQARDWVDAQLRVLDCEVRRDAVGNTVAHNTGLQPNLKPLAIGSHTDTVPNGGRFDGALGVLAAMACVRALQTSQLTLKHPLEIINFMAEEATMSGGTTGSQMMAGLFNPQQFEQKAWDGAICPTAMIFVPSVGGVSHSPDEFTRDEDCVNGANVLLNALVRVDEEIRD